MSVNYTYVSNMDSGSLTSESGHHRFTNKLYGGTIFSGMQLTADGLTLSLTISQGEFRIPYSGYYYNIYMDSNSTLSIAAGDITMDREDVIVAYVDRTVQFSSSTVNNPNAAKFMAVKGDVSNNPSIQTSTAIQNAVGIGNPFIVLGAVYVPARSQFLVQSNIVQKSDPITNQSMGQGAFPVGTIYTETTGVNPENSLGFGTWVPFGQGKTLIGIDTTQVEFDTVGKVGGEKLHSLSVDEMPSHNHSGTTDHAGSHNHHYGGPNDSHGEPLWGTGDHAYPSITLMDGGGGTGTSWDGAHSHNFTTDPTGSNQGHENRQPYITAYFWERIS